MNHAPEFSDTSRREADEVKRRALAEVTARAYARVFVTDDGKHVLEDLRRKFGHDRARFDVRDKHQSSVVAAVIDGQCTVLREIETAIRAGGGAC